MGAFYLILAIFFFVSCSKGTLAPFDNWAHQRVQLKDVSIHFRYAGTGPPILLVHGNPQHSLTWHTVGPILAQNYTVIAPDNRGAGDSSIPANGDYSSATEAEDLKGVLDLLNITQVYVFSHDKGASFATALAIKYPSLVKRLGVSENVLPGFGYESASAPSPSWDLYSNWQLAFFSVTDAAEFFISGKVREMLSWYFFHTSYSGMEAISQDHLNRYTTQISKPGFLRSCLGPFSNALVAQDNEFFSATLGPNPLTIPFLALAGEASLAPFLQAFWGPVAKNLTAGVVPKAGHWIADENPEWVAERLLRFFGEDSGISSVDLGWLANKVTLL
ncbi:alpha/beta-hydrolase [Glonium stellatum]|uniref:Alpha/beta-hydrolase n=1 Tax=Glonium stellatum TaxID=574774 RepID=A0A8E2JMZ0_9PEZI|nr:alpha/beta-hydrolase [Glonium stellatum]